MEYDATNPELGMVIEYKHMSSRGKFIVTDIQASITDYHNSTTVVYEEHEEGCRPIRNQKLTLSSWKIMVSYIVDVKDVYYKDRKPAWEV